MALYLFIIVAFSLIVGVVFLGAHRCKKIALKIHQKDKKKLKEIYPDLFSGVEYYKFYVPDHPYVWVQVDYNEFEKRLISSCMTPRGMPQSPKYSIKVDEVGHKAYIVCWSENYDFSKLKHYDEWLQSNAEVAKNIAKHKNL